MPIRKSKQRIKKKVWRIVGFVSSVIGLLCFGLSSSFIHLFGEWNFLKIIVYTMLSFCISSMMLLLKKWKLSRSFLLKAHLGVLVLLLTSLYSFFSDKDLKAKPDLLSLISCAAFALMSFCLSRQIDLGFEADLLNFFLGCLTVQLMKINLMLSIIAAIFCYSLMILRSKLDSRSVMATRRMENHVTIDIDAANEVERGANDSRSDLQSHYSSGHPLLQSLRRRVNDGYNWRTYEEKKAKRTENQTSYYRCAHTNCSVKKKVERTIDGEIIEILYKGNHAHCKPKLPMKRNSSSESVYSLLPSVPTEISDQSFASHGSGLDGDAVPEDSSLSI